MAHEPVLVVDDNPINLKLLQVVLDDEGYDVRSASSAEQMFSLLASFHPRVILLDLHLDGIDGLDLARRLKADPATRDIVIVAVTGAALPGDDRRAREAGCDDYVTKPIDTAVLPDIVARHLVGA